MMGVESSIGHGVKIIDKIITVTPISISGIPSDKQGDMVTLEIFRPRGADYFVIRPHDWNGSVNVHPVWINSAPEDNPNSLVYNELQNLIDNLFDTEEYKPQNNFLTQANRAISPTETRTIRIKSTENSGHEITDASAMDIEVAGDGDVTLTVRSNGEPEERKLLFLSKTAENGGRFPQLATVFTRIAEQVETAV